MTSALYKTNMHIQIFIVLVSWSDSSHVSMRLHSVTLSQFQAIQSFHLLKTLIKGQIHEKVYLLTGKYDKCMIQIDNSWAIKVIQRLTSLQMALLPVNIAFGGSVIMTFKCKRNIVLQWEKKIKRCPDKTSHQKNRQEQKSQLVILSFVKTTMIPIKSCHIITWQSLSLRGYLLLATWRQTG